VLIVALDLVIIASALAAAWLWFQASGGRLRRVSRREEIDAADLNRIVVAVNRAQLLNRRGALAATVSALLVALRAAADLPGRL
jgi:hypothetical protein